MELDEQDELLPSSATQNADRIRSSRQRAEQELIETKEALERKTQEFAHTLSLMRATLESTWDGILVTNDGGRITDFNEQYGKMWQIPRNILDSGENESMLKFVSKHFRDPQQFLARIQEIYASSPRETFDVLELKDGRVFERFSKTQSVNDRNVGRVWSFRDITATRRTEEALRDETRVLELLNKTGIMLSSTLDLQALVQAVTDAATQLSGAQFGAFFCNMTDDSGAPYLLYTASGEPPEAFDQMGLLRARMSSPTFRREESTRCDDAMADPLSEQISPYLGLLPGHLPVRSYLAVPVKSRFGKVIGDLFFGHSEVGVFSERAERLVVGIAAQAAVAIDNARLYEAAQRSAEERKQLLESERAARSEAERASSMKDEFVATVSHELRTPLSAILGWSRVLRFRKMSEADVQKGLETIERNAHAQSQLIEDLLDMSRITSGKLRLDVQPIEPVSFIEAAIETLNPAATAKGVRVEKLLDTTAGPMMGDPSRLQQIVWNLLSNAIKFTPEGGKVQVVLKRVNSQVEITVSDTGVGITSEFLPYVFDRFRQEDASTTRHFGGLGLGLSIVRRLVELHGGSITVHSPGQGRGANFIVSLPLMVDRHFTHGDRLHIRTPNNGELEFKRSDLSGLRVLVVDDEEDARDLIERILIECDAEVFTASNAREALALLEAERPEVLISDISMPDIDGYELLRKARLLEEAGGRKIPAIALTAFARSEDRTRALRAGFLVHVSKPIEPSELVASVASVAGRTGRTGVE